VSTPSTSHAQIETVTAKLDRFIQETVMIQRIPGVAVGITHGDSVLFLRGYGEGITPQSQFLIASVSKSFTALAVMQLVETGQIDLDTSAQAYLPEFTTTDPEAAARITVRHLLNQTSGLADAGFSESLMPQPTSLAERIVSLQTADIISEPGTTFHYHNPNYAVLARLVEVVSGQPFDFYLQTNVFAPLDMAHTRSAATSDEARARAESLAQGHIAAYGMPIAVDEMSGFLEGSGGMTSTAEDMTHYLIAQNNGGRYENIQVISPESLTTMHTPPHGIETTYAMGWLTAEHNGTRTIEHDGILSAYYAEAVLLPETSYGVVLLYNEYSLPSSMIAFPQLKEGIVNILAGRPPTSSPITGSVYGIILGLLTVIGVLLAVRSLVWLPRWQAKHRKTPLIRLLPDLLWTFLPAVLVLLLPQLVAYSGRVFNMEQLFRSMPEVYLWLGTVGLLGVINGIARIILRLRAANDQTG
jgi:CubicO group peptidase (beta-lactamase class C family)